MIYLIGIIDHGFQHDVIGSVDENARRKFLLYLESTIKRYKASLISEENSEEALRESNSTIRPIADKLNIKHLFCDPDREERNNIGIPSREEIKSMLNIQGLVCENSVEDNQIKEEQRKYHPIREKFWFGKIEPYLSEVIIFLCGFDHIKSFEFLLIDKGYTPKVLVAPL